MAAPNAQEGVSLSARYKLRAKAKGYSESIIDEWGHRGSETYFIYALIVIFFEIPL
jgi:hypothetical protein